MVKRVKEKGIEKSKSYTVNNLNWLVGGEAGFGIHSAGHNFALTCSRNGLQVFGNAEYPSLIRGGHNSFAIRVADFPIGIHCTAVDLLLAMNRETLDLHLGEIVPGGGVIYDGEVIADYEFPVGVKTFGVPLKKLAREFGKNEITRNSVAVGASLALLDFGLETYLSILKEKLAGKGKVVIQNNLAAARAGFDYLRANYQVEDFGYKLRVVESAPRRLLISGNQTVALGAIKAGVKLVAEYPMTPSSTILHFMAKAAKDYHIIVKHTEDELAAINMVIGASWAGVRAMTATSGGGFSLMTEALGMAGMTETPAVIYEVQRGGPSTGLPTRTEQSDLRFAIHASQGEFPRIVMAPGDYQELFRLTFEAFNLADRWQLPVIIMSDKHLGETLRTVLPFAEKNLKIDRGELIQTEGELEKLRINKPELFSKDGGFFRYKFSMSGVSTRVRPGIKGGRYRSSTDEHDESGDLSEAEENRNLMQAKRMRKLEACLKELPAPVLVGPAEDGSFTAGPAYAAGKADLTLVTWGSPKEALLEVIQKLKLQGIKANLLQIVYMVPFHSKEVKEILGKCKFKIGVEMNYEGQLSDYLLEKTGVAMDRRILKWSGRQFTAQELFDRVISILNKS